ncbi:MAG: hypothetical protein ABJE95_09760 [Byssovorax sp.]
MSTMTRSSSETSAMFSLAELAKIEQARVEEEDALRARAKDKEARARSDAEAGRRAAETAQIAADADARAKRMREEAAEKARIEARERAAADVARIEAESKARLEAANAERAHELVVLRARAEGRKSRLQIALAAALGLVVLGGGAAGYQASQRVASLEQDTSRLREEHLSLARERDNAKSTDLAALDRRYAALRARPLASGAAEATATAEAARNAIDPRSVDHGRLRAFGEAIDGLDARIDALDKVAALDHREADLAAWAADRRRSELTSAARGAAARARSSGADEASIRLYEGALDQLRNELAQTKTGTGAAVSGVVGPVKTTVACKDGDPGCGLDGTRLF